MDYDSRIPKALQACRVDLERKSKSKTANLLEDPTRGQDAELFEEGWEGTSEDGRNQRILQGIEPGWR
jgi:hypothetical protein